MTVSRYLYYYLCFLCLLPMDSARTKLLHLERNDLVCNFSYLLTGAFISASTHTPGRYSFRLTADTLIALLSHADRF